MGKFEKAPNFSNKFGAVKDVDRNDIIDIVTKVIKVIGDLMKK